MLGLVILSLCAISCTSDDGAKPFGVQNTSEVVPGKQKQAGTAVLMKRAKDEKGIVIIKNFYSPLDHNDPKKYIAGAEEVDYYEKFDFSTGRHVDKDSDDWDIAFGGYYTIVNGGAQSYDNEPERSGDAAAAILVNTTFEAVTDVKDVKWNRDQPGQHAIPTDVMSKTKGVWHYDFTPHIVHPIPNRILVCRTRDGRYVKVQIISFYKDILDQEKIPARSYDFNFYTFRYAFIEGQQK